MSTTHRVFDELIGKTPWKIEQHTDKEGDVISLEIHWALFALRVGFSTPTCKHRWWGGCHPTQGS